MTNDIYKSFKEDIKNPHFENWEELIINLYKEYNKHENKKWIQDIVLRLLDVKEKFPEKIKLLEHLVGELGLFPYLDTNYLGYKDKIRNSFFSAPIKGDFTFHIKQAEVFNRILKGENIVLSAPTSFGKSLIIESILGSGVFKNIVIVVPTIALIDELKNKFFEYKDTYKIITQSHQSTTEKNIFIFTQERVLECENLDNIDFFIIDEFYKLMPIRTEDLRCDSLNLAFQKLYNKVQRFYMLGPNIQGLVDGLEIDLNCTFLKFDEFKTVSSNEEYFFVRENGTDPDKDVDRDRHLFEVLPRIIERAEQTVIFCKSPQRVANVMAKILESGLLELINVNSELATWLRDTYHPDWSLSFAIEHGLAYHHGKLPRALSSLMVELFNKEKIKILVCTSTLIEGVNTSAKNMIIYDDCITGREKLDAFTFNNISGRSGRMFKYFVGNVYIFGERPQPQLPFIDIPIITHSENASESMLLHVSDELSEENEERISYLKNQYVLPIYLIKKHQNILPERLINFALDLTSNADSYHNRMIWNTPYPNYNELQLLSEIIHQYFLSTHMKNSVKTASQLNRKIRNIINHTSDRDLIQEDYNYWSQRDWSYTVDNAVQVLFDFKRNLVGYNLPKIILAINDIQEYIFKGLNYSYGNFIPFAHSLESFYEIPAITTLEEFGIPFEISKKISERINLTSDDDIDSTIDKIKTAYANNYLLAGLSSFEEMILLRALKYM
ncbi:DEAD/DEAH box helicase [Aliarcobacter butzleri]|uniref:DEAD/DEAH box helicase n=1 Tax=Aliarcobacter butzleri TaxID=28197 RepID=UPI001EDB1C71|nr:DEAD/DEAH box helicase [Aliarcobacter butzleri]MCG3658054.1 DEAD/DEAH box helicase [Aliarcobacter butzleri]